MKSLWRYKVSSVALVQRAQAHEPMQRSDQDNFKAYLRGGKRKVNGTRGRVLAVITGGISAAHIDSLAFLK